MRRDLEHARNEKLRRRIAAIPRSLAQKRSGNGEKIEHVLQRG